MRSYRLAAVALSLGFAAPAVAQELEKPAPKADAAKPVAKPDEKKSETDDRTQESVLTTKFVEAFSSSDWEKAIAAFVDLGENYPTYKGDPTYAYRYCVALKSVGGPKAAENIKKCVEKLDDLLKAFPDHILAMFLLAQIKAVDSKAQSKEDAKELLLNAARNGFYTLREVQAWKGPEFKYLKDDPKFILKAMRASQEFIAVVGKTVRNPFLPPSVKQEVVTDKPTDGGANVGDKEAEKKELAQLEARIDTLFLEIDRVVGEQNLEKLTPLFNDLSVLLAQARSKADKKIQEKLLKWNTKAEEWKEIKLAIQLQLYLSEANEYLRAMFRAKQAEKYDEIFEIFTNVKVLVDKMKHEEREEFHRNADAILQRAKELNDQAIKLKKIKEFNVTVVGITIDPRPATADGKAMSGNHAIIIFDDADKRGRIYGEGDSIRDKDDRKIQGLVVSKVRDGAVVFKYEDTEFARDLQTPSNAK